MKKIIITLLSMVYITLTSAVFASPGYIPGSSVMGMMRAFVSNYNGLPNPSLALDTDLYVAMKKVGIHPAGIYKNTNSSWKLSEPFPSTNIVNGLENSPHFINGTNYVIDFITFKSNNSYLTNLINGGGSLVLNRITYLSNRISSVSNVLNQFILYQTSLVTNELHNVLYLENLKFATNLTVRNSFTSFSNRISTVSNSLWWNTFYEVEGNYNVLHAQISSNSNRSFLTYETKLNSLSKSNSLEISIKNSTNTLHIVINNTATNYKPATNALHGVVSSEDYIKDLIFSTNDITRSYMNQYSTNSIIKPWVTNWSYIWGRQFATNISVNNHFTWFSNNINSKSNNLYLYTKSVTNGLISHFISVSNRIGSISNNLNTKINNQSNNLYGYILRSTNLAISNIERFDYLQDIIFATNNFVYSHFSSFSNYLTNNYWRIQETNNTLTSKGYFDDKRRFLNAGTYTAPTVTVNSTNGRVKISGDGICVFHANADNSGVTISFLMDAYTNTTITSNLQYFILANYNFGSPTYQISTIYFVNGNVFPVGGIFWEKLNGVNEVHLVLFDDQARETASQSYAKDVQLYGFTRKSGLSLGVTTNKGITISAGLVYYGNTVYQVPAVDTSLSGGISKVYFISNGSWVVITNKTWNNLYYQAESNRKEVYEGSYVVNWIYRDVIDNDNSIIRLYGVESNSTLLDAQSSSPPDNVPPVLQYSSILVGRIVVQKSSNTPTQVDSVFKQNFNISPAPGIHNNLQGMQGGKAGEYYHLTLAQVNDIVNFGFIITNQLEYKVNALSKSNSLYARITSVSNNLYLYIVSGTNKVHFAINQHISQVSNTLFSLLQTATNSLHGVITNWDNISDLKFSTNTKVTNWIHQQGISSTNFTVLSTNVLHGNIPTPTFFGTNFSQTILFDDKAGTNAIHSVISSEDYVYDLIFATNSSVKTWISTTNYNQGLKFSTNSIIRSYVNQYGTNSNIKTWISTSNMALTNRYHKIETNSIITTNWLHQSKGMATTNYVNSDIQLATNFVHAAITNWDYIQDSKYSTNIVLYTNQISTPTSNAIIVSSNLGWDYQGSTDTNAKSKLFFDGSLSTGLYLTNYSLVSIKGSISYQFGSLTTINQWKIYCANMFNENFNLMASNSSGWSNLNHYNLRNDGSGILVSSIFTNNVGYLNYKLSVSNYSPGYVPYVFEIQYFYWKPPLSIRQYIDTNNLALAKRDLQFVTNMSTVSYTVQVSTPTNVTTIIQSNFDSPVPKSFFDGNIATAGGTIGSTGNAVISYGFNQSWVVNNYAIYYQAGGGGPGYSVTVVLFGSNSGWTQLDSQTYGSFPAAWQTISIANTSAYYRYKVEVLASYPSGGSFGMNEVALYNVGPRPNHYFMTNVFNQLIVSPTNTIQSRVTRISNTIVTTNWIMTKVTNFYSIGSAFTTNKYSRLLNTTNLGTNNGHYNASLWPTLTNSLSVGSYNTPNTNYVVFDMNRRCLRVNTLGAGWYQAMYVVSVSNASTIDYVCALVISNNSAGTVASTLIKGSITKLRITVGSIVPISGNGFVNIPSGYCVKLKISQNGTTSSTVKVMNQSVMIRREE